MRTTRQLWRRLGGLLLAACGLAAGSASAVETVTYYHADALGTPVMESNAAGAVTYVRAHRPYGQQALGAANGARR